MQIIKAANLLLRFLVELVAWAGYGIWGYHIGPNTPARLALAILLPLLVMVIWGVFVSPKARYKLSRPRQFALQTAILGGGGLAIAAAGYPQPALLFAEVAVLNTALMALWKQ